MCKTKLIDDTVYSISKTGDVYNNYHNRQLKSRVVKAGYCIVDLKIDGRRICKYIHRLVAQAFLENPNNYSDVHHKDNDKTNNTVGNLEWTTRSKNCRMSSKIRKVVCHVEYLGIKWQINTSVKYLKIVGYGI